MKKILVIAPHGDDEVLGCGGYMLDQIKRGAEVHVLFATMGGVDVRQPLDKRLAEVECVARATGYKYDIIIKIMDAMLDTIPSRDLISAIDKKIAEFQPDEVFVNYPSNHQDHIKLYQCAKAAMRLKEGFMPSFFALYEYPFITYNDVLQGGLFYFDITEYIDKKVELFYLYKTQIKHSPSPLNEEGVKILARMRGLECGRKYAEMFYVQKMVK